MTINIQQLEIIDYQYITLIVSERERGSNPSLERQKKESND